jgi:hypothetical protein
MSTQSGALKISSKDLTNPPAYKFSSSQGMLDLLKLVLLVALNSELSQKSLTTILQLSQEEQDVMKVLVTDNMNKFTDQNHSMSDSLSNEEDESAI